MQNINEIKEPPENKNISKLSKDAIHFLDNQMIPDGETREIEVDFTFQVICATKRLPNWYCVSLMDQKSKFGGFCIKWNQHYGEPKEGDIINIKKIRIVKLPYRDTNIYFGEKVRRIEESKKMLINPRTVESIAKVRSTSKKKTYLKYNLFQNYNEKDNDILFNININNININSPVQERIKSNIGNDLLEQNKNNNSIRRKPTLISELNSFINNPFFILKCLAKTEIIEFFSKYNKIGIDYVQNYLFADVNGDKIQGVTYTYDNTERINKILKINSIYEISKVNRRMDFKKDFAFTNHNIQLSFNGYTEIKELTEEEAKQYQFKEKKDFTKLKDILGKENKIFSLYSIVLEDKGIIEKKRLNNNDIVKYRRLIIGDDSFYKVSLKLWNDLTQPNKTYLKGDIICIKDFKYKNWNNYYELNSIVSISKIEYADESKRGKVLKKFYHSHQKIEEYKDLCFIELDNKKDIKMKFIDDLLDEFKKEKQIFDNLYKINGIVRDIEHKDANVFSGCKFCGKMFDDICPNCKSYHKKLYFNLE